MGLVFEDPPEVRRKARPHGYHQEVAEELRTYAGEWARVDSYSTPSSASSMAQSIRRANLAAYRPPGAFEATSRKVGNEFRVYARYVGEDSDDR